MTCAETIDRSAAVRAAEADAERWGRYVDTLLRGFGPDAEVPPGLRARMEELRHKRDRVSTKVEALKRHQSVGWEVARGELESARADLHDAWHSALGALRKERLFA